MTLELTDEQVSLLRALLNYYVTQVGILKSHDVGADKAHDDLALAGSILDRIREAQ